MIEALKSQHIYGFIVQHPFQMGYQGVHTVYRAMHGKDIKQKVNTDVVFISRENINYTEIRKMLGLHRLKRDRSPLYHNSIDRASNPGI